MSVLLKVIFIGFCVGVSAPLFRKNAPEFGIVISICGTVLIAGEICGYISSAVSEIKELAALSGIGGKYMSSVLKMILIAYLCEYASSVIEDAGEKAAAKNIELAGKLIIFIMTFPILAELFGSVAAMVGK